MPSLNKDNSGDGLSFVKPVIIVVVILLVVAAAYLLFAKKNETKNAPKAEDKKTELNETGIDPNQKVNNAQDVEEIVAKWIAANPKAILESVTNMQRKAAADQMQDAQKNIVNKKSELESSDSPSYAPSGYDVTIVEFFDYSCGYCKKAQGTVEELIKEDKKIRIIYKEYPILGQASLEMSQVAIAVHLMDKSAYKKVHDAFMKSSERGKDAAIKIAKSVGVDGAKLEASLKNNQDKISKIIQETSALGQSVGISGTPGFVIGEELIPGAVDVDTFKEKVANLRK
jgi:protein-disulfide isomerase